MLIDVALALEQCAPKVFFCCAFRHKLVILFLCAMIFLDEEADGRGQKEKAKE